MRADRKRQNSSICAHTHTCTHKHIHTFAYTVYFFHSLSSSAPCHPQQHACLCFSLFDEEPSVNPTNIIPFSFFSPSLFYYLTLFVTLGSWRCDYSSETLPSPTSAITPVRQRKRACRLSPDRGPSSVSFSIQTGHIFLNMRLLRRVSGKGSKKNNNNNTFQVRKWWIHNEWIRNEKWSFRKGAETGSLGSGVGGRDRSPLIDKWWRVCRLLITHALLSGTLWAVSFQRPLNWRLLVLVLTTTHLHDSDDGASIFRSLRGRILFRRCAEVNPSLWRHGTWQRWWTPSVRSLWMCETLLLLLLLCRVMLS